MSFVKCVKGVYLRRRSQNHACRRLTFTQSHYRPNNTGSNSPSLFKWKTLIMEATHSSFSYHRHAYEIATQHKCYLGVMTSVCRWFILKHLRASYTCMLKGENYINKTSKLKRWCTYIKMTWQLFKALIVLIWS